jgi:hypothetical protein
MIGVSVSACRPPEWTAQVHHSGLPAAKTKKRIS